MATKLCRGKNSEESLALRDENYIRERYSRLLNPDESTQHIINSIGNLNAAIYFSDIRKILERGKYIYE